MTAAPDAAPCARPRPGRSLRADLAASISWAWRVIRTFPRAFVIPGACWVLLGLAADALTAYGRTLPRTEIWGWTGPPLPFDILSMTVTTLALIGSMLWSTGCLRAGVDVIAWRRPTPRRTAVGDGATILTTIIVGALIGLGFLVLIVPGAIMSVIWIFAAPAAARDGRAPSPLATSSSLVGDRLGPTILTCVLVGLATSLFSASIAVSAAIAPVVQLFLMGMFQRLQGAELPDPLGALSDHPDPDLERSSAA